MSIKYEDALHAVEVAEQYGVKYGVIFQCRYNTPSMLVKQRVCDGSLGAVKCGRTTLTWYRPDNYYDGSDWKGTWDKEGGGVVIDQAIHSTLQTGLSTASLSKSSPLCITEIINV